MEKVCIEFIKWVMSPFVITCCLILLIGFIIAVWKDKWRVLQEAKVVSQPVSRLMDKFMEKLPVNNKKNEK